MTGLKFKGKPYAYYRPGATSDPVTRKESRCGHMRHWLKAEDVEKLLLRELVKMIGDEGFLKISMERAQSNLDEIEELKREKAELEKEMKKVVAIRIYF